ncbi:MAG: hypothetical protein V1731_03325 [Candidatus Aenigmatarchaeota archaeon]
MTSSRTLYREKRVELIKECIGLLVGLLTIEKKDLERIPLPTLKNVKKVLENPIVTKV